MIKLWCRPFPILYKCKLLEVDVTIKKVTKISLQLEKC